MSDTYPWTAEEVQIIKGCWADPNGRLALTLIVERLGILHGQAFDSDALRMAWHEGRRFVAREIMAAINNPVEKLVIDDDTGSSSRPLTATERVVRAAAGSVHPAARRPKR